MARLETEDRYVIDELRIATAFAEAAGVPVPASLTQLAFGAVGLAVYCWRRRRPSRASRGA